MNMTTLSFFRQTCSCALLVAMFVLSTVAAQAARVAGTPVVYKTVDDQQLKLYVVKPQGWSADDRRPALVFYHGGGWVGGAPSAFNEQAEYLASRGMVCILPEYRLLGKTMDPPTICIEDAKSAFRWVRSHAGELGIDPEHIAAGGGSAGGHLAAALALLPGFDDPSDDLSVSCRPDALVLYNPVIDNGPDGYGYRRIGDRYPEFSPFHNVRSDAPPTIIFVGTEDKLVPVDMILDFEKRMQEAGVLCEAYVYEGLPHSVFHRRYAGERGFYLCLEQTDRFFEELGWLKGEPTLKKPAGLDDL